MISARVFLCEMNSSKDYPPILYIPVPQVGHLPLSAGFPFFMVTRCAFGSSLFSRHFTQYMLAIFVSPPLTSPKAGFTPLSVIQ